MASIASLTSASFRGTPLTEAYSASFDYGGGLTSARSLSTPWSANGGTVTVELYGNVSTSMWGKYGQLILNGSVSLTVNAICTSVSAAAQVNDAHRNTLTFQIVG